MIRLSGPRIKSGAEVLLRFRFGLRGGRRGGFARLLAPFGFALLFSFSLGFGFRLGSRLCLRLQLGLRGTDLGSTPLFIGDPIR